MVYFPLRPSKKAVALVGEFAYKDALRRCPDGEVLLEVVPEPDNPFDSRAISCRYYGQVIGYIPREKTSRYWSNLARIAASGMTATCTGRIESDGDFYEAYVYLQGGDNALPHERGLISKRKDYQVPPAYIEPRDTGGPRLAERSPQFRYLDGESTLTKDETIHRSQDHQQRVAKLKKENEERKKPSNAAIIICIVVLLIIVSVL